MKLLSYLYLKFKLKMKLLTNQRTPIFLPLFLPYKQFLFDNVKLGTN